jgi:hypothetical protein
VLLLPRGGVNVDDVLPRCLGAGLLWGSGCGLVLLGGGSLCHVWLLVLVDFVVIVIDCFIIVTSLSLSSSLVMSSTLVSSESKGEGRGFDRHSA